MSKKYSMFLTTLFCGFLALMVTANALTPDREFSELENRALSQRPKLSWKSVRSGEFMSAYESYTTDQFAGRDGWTAAKAYMEAIVCQAKQAESEIETYYAGSLEEARSNPMGDPLLYIAAKYQCSWSDYFDASMPADQRQWTFSQLKAMLTESRVALNDPYALAASGGPRTAEAMEKAARQAAKSALDALIHERAASVE